MTIEQFTRGRDRLLRVIEADADMPRVLDEILAAMHDVTAFSWCSLMPVDPTTLLPTAAIVEGFAPETCAPWWDIELLEPGFNKLSALARSSDPVATLVDATDGDLARAPLYLKLYEPLGVADELRVAFIVGTTCWGTGVFVRAVEDGPFTDAEVEHVRHLVPIAARLLRAAACRLEADASGPATMLVVDCRNQLADLTIEAGALLDDLRTTGVHETGLPTIVITVAIRARGSRTSKQIATRVRGRSGRWLRVTAIPMEGDSGNVAVMIEPARLTDLLPILLESYGLTDRETEIVPLLARGLATKEIAAELTVSPHTVRDHVKSIYAKAGVNSRGELVARLFAEHIADGAFKAAVRHAG